MLLKHLLEENILMGSVGFSIFHRPKGDKNAYIEDIEAESAKEIEETYNDYKVVAIVPSETSIPDEKLGIKPIIYIQVILSSEDVAPEELELKSN